MIGRDRLLEVRCMAGKARRRESGELTGGLALVTIRAFKHRVGPKKREAILVLF